VDGDGATTKGGLMIIGHPYKAIGQRHVCEEAHTVGEHVN